MKTPTFAALPARVRIAATDTLKVRCRTRLSR